MNQRQTGLLATVAAVGTALLLLLFFALSFRLGRPSPEIILPPDTSAPGAPPPVSPSEAEVSAAPLTRGVLEITNKNVTAIVADLKRPVNYSFTGEYTLYAGETALTTTQRIYILGEFQKTEYLDATGAIEKTEILEPSNTYIWDSTPGASLKKIATGGFPKDASARMPTYEDVLGLPSGEITGAGYLVVDGKPCVWVHTMETGEAGYSVEYNVDMENGLLLSAYATQYGIPAWSFLMRNNEQGAVTDSDFMLPTGRTAFEESSYQE